MQLTITALMFSALPLGPQQSDVEIMGRTTIEARGTAASRNVTWYTADLHVHANGCNSHSTTQQVIAAMQSSGTNIGNALIWGDSIAYDWPNFLGQVNDPLSLPNHILRWDFEISAFPESWQGHMLMINVAQKNAVFGGQPRWPGRSYYVPNYDWVQSGGGIVGYAHANFWTAGSFKFGLIDDRAPRALILDVTLKKVDFISTEFVEDPDFYWFWYKMLDAGFKIAPTASTDFPCQSGVGSHHTVFPVSNSQRLSFDAYVDAVRTGKTVIRQNTSTLDHLDIRVNGQGLGSVVHLPPPSVTVPDVTSLPGSSATCIEVDASSAEPGAEVQLVINSAVIDTQPVSANLKTYQWSVTLSKSSWVAARIVEGGGTRNRTHTAATFVLLGDCPIRNDPASALQWIHFLDDYAAAALATPPFALSELSVNQNFKADIAKAKRTWLGIALDSFSACPN